VRVVNVYVPNGEEVGSEKYSYKLSGSRRWINFSPKIESPSEAGTAGDYNIAPEERDVHDPKRWRATYFQRTGARGFSGLVPAWFADVFRKFDQPG